MTQTAGLRRYSAPNSDPLESPSLKGLQGVSALKAHAERHPRGYAAQRNARARTTPQGEAARPAGVALAR